MDEKSLSASWQALVRLGRVYAAGAIAYLLLQVPDLIGVIDWTKLGDAGPMWMSIATLLLTGVLNFVGKLVREPTVPVSVAEAAAAAPEGVELRHISRDKPKTENLPI